MENTIEISVIIPTHRIDWRFFRAINSVQRQSNPPKEIVLVFDGIDFDTNKLISRTNKIDYTIIKLKKNLGPAAARNIGIKSAGGNYIAFLDCDDSWHEDKLKNQLSFLNQHNSKSLILCVSPVSIMKNETKLKQRYPIVDKSPETIERLFRGPFLYLGSTLLASKELFKSVGMFNENMRVYEDFEWQIRFANKSGVKIICSDEPYVNIERSYSIRHVEDMSISYDNLRSTLLAQVEDFEGRIKFVDALYHLDLAKSYLGQGSMLKFVLNIIISFSISPRLKLHTDTYWKTQTSFFQKICDALYFLCRRKNLSRNH